MAVATPILERSSLQELEDIKHNSLIKERYARLVNPDARISDLRAETEYEENKEEASVSEYTEPEMPEIAEPVPETRTHVAEPYLAPSGRADAEIFRADSAINKRLRTESAVAPSAESEEEENEDLRPTSTTIQYKTEKLQSNVEEGGKISVEGKKKLSLSKRDIAVIAVVATIIVALFVLIIVNSAIISGINNDLSRLQSSLNTVKGAFASVSDQINDFINNHLEENVRRLAESLGMVKN